MDLQMFEMRGVRLIGMLIGLTLLCVNGWATPAVAASTVGKAQASEQGSDEVGQVGEAVELVASAPVAGISDRERRLKKRLVTVAVLGGVMLLMLAVAYGYFRLELTTRGFYSGRLQIVSGIASLVVVTAAYFLWSWLVG